ncbi:MAG: CynX/NimT family MFS transporter [Candidatus Dormibacteraceae bacterium]
MTSRTAWARLGLLWLGGADLRVTLLAVPPLLPAIHRSLHLDERTVGILSGLPLLLLAAAAVPGSLLIARIGARRAIVAGLTAVAVAGALRGARPSVALLLGATVVMGVGIALCQPSLPSLVRQWFPTRSAQATAAFSNGLLVGEITGASLTLPIVVGLVGGWQRALAFWSLPVAAGAVAILAVTRHQARDRDLPRARWWPDWTDGVTWRLGLILGCASVSYFATNAFLPDYLRAHRQVGLVPLALASVNVCQLPASALVAALPGRLVSRRWPLVGAGLAILTSALGVIFLGGGGLVVLWVGLVGLASALVFVLALALPPILAGPNDVHRLSAAMFTISYACAFAGPLAGGAIWDATRIPATAFVPVLGGGALVTLVAAGLRLPPAAGGRAAGGTRTGS